MPPTAYVVLVFRGAGSVWTHLVAGVTSLPGHSERFSHVDVLVYGGGGEPYSFCSYMQQPLQRLRPDECMYRKGCDHALALAVSGAEARAARSLLQEMYLKGVGYNYTDLPLCLLPTALKCSLHDVEDARSLTRVFCSQLAVLTLRESGSGAAVEAVRALNSRCTAPNELYEALCSSFQSVKVEALMMGLVQEGAAPP